MGAGYSGMIKWTALAAISPRLEPGVPIRASCVGCKLDVVRPLVVCTLIADKEASGRDLTTHPPLTINTIGGGLAALVE